MTLCSDPLLEIKSRSAFLAFTQVPHEIDKPNLQSSKPLLLNVTDNNNEVFFKIKRSTQLKKLMDAFCERQGKAPNSVRFLFDGSRVQPTDSPDKLDMQDGDTLEVHQEQIGGQ
ncbi:hypothetical protein EYC80_010529 [Monilinia laxa]|uniref:Ubiquitin-like domain-containing protein n=1 Tax=Monilinia laxa TaxID=61186 RepID=A0A5N6JMJ4_MONLA|nr:hypothetical protein EYC80_010529 [Monilinia laxa]